MLFVPRRLPGAQACAEPHPFGMQDMKKDSYRSQIKANSREVGKHAGGVPAGYS